MFCVVVVVAVQKMRYEEFLRAVVVDVGGDDWYHFVVVFIVEFSCML